MIGRGAGECLNFDGWPHEVNGTRVGACLGAARGANFAFFVTHRRTRSVLTVHVVSHTHWDREWYHLAGRFRQRLVALIDDLLDDPPRERTSFLLDAQTVVLDDYLAVRPERAAEVAALLRRGAIEAGPWFVLADELIPRAESLVRNLLAGRRAMRALRAEAPPVLYCPDSFGHPAALPTLARGFGLDIVVVWRGFGSGRWPAGDACWWTAPSGERVLLYHLPRSGYEFGSDLPADPAAAVARWRTMHDELAPRSRLSVVLLTNGADHHARQRRLPEAIAALAAAALPAVVEASSLRAFAGAALAAADGSDLPVVHGELRDSYGYTWTLLGTLATRAPQKRRAAAVERLLICDSEPWVALAARRTGRSRRALMQAAWRELLLCHPHDTLCGCSVDAVARAFDARLDEADAQAAGLRDDALGDLAGFDAERSRSTRESWQPQLVVRNPAARARGGVAMVELSRFVADVRVGPGSGHANEPARRASRGVPRVNGVSAVQPLDRALVHERLESPRAYPDDDLVERSRALVWVSPIGGYGLRAFAVGTGRWSSDPVPNPVRVDGMTVANGRLTVTVGDDGAVTVLHRASGREIKHLLMVEDQDDAGDLYAPSPRGPVRAGRFLGARTLHRGPLRGAVETRWRVSVRRAEHVVLRVSLSLDADAEFVRVSVAGDNLADDHRVRLRFATDVRAPLVRADAAFGPIVRVPLEPSPEEARVEAAPPTAPLHRYVTLCNAACGATLYSDGLAEYEATADGAIRVALLRAVGELSRNDLPERPGHAGWPTPTPEAQSRGAFAAEFALLLHDSWSDEIAALVERTADDVLLPLTGATMRAAIAPAVEVSGLELQGMGLAFSAAKESDDGMWMVLRCVNVLDRPVRGVWCVADGIHEARLARLDETPGDALVVRDDAVEFDAPPRGVVTVLAR